jgi:hypothetical protein
MKIIFSRKGFDWKSGGVASPIFPDGRLFSLPIPSRRSKYRFENVAFGRGNLGTIVKGLTKGRLTERHGTHVDPDLRRGVLPRGRGWLPAFGPSGPAQTHLAKNGVGVDDIFLFFGWFREVEKENGRYQYVGKAPNIHVLFGWLQIGRVYREFPRDSKLPSWANPHAEVSDREEWRDAEWYYDNSAVYVANNQLDIPGLRKNLPGGGVFEKYDDRLRLTEPGRSRCNWRLPGWMYPSRGRRPLTYHEDRSRWGKDRVGRTSLRTVARGQEFVLHMQDYPEAKRWLANLFNAAA